MKAQSSGVLTVFDTRFPYILCFYSDVAWPHGVLEKQADMIRYLQQHNEHLSRRLLRQSRVASGTST